MTTRVTNLGLRLVLLAGIITASAILGFAAIRHAIADQWAKSSNPALWMHAATLEPSNAEHWYRLGRYRQLDFDNADLSLATSYYQRATKINPASSRYWADLAGVYEMGGNLAQAERAFRSAQQNYPISGDLAWRFGNFLLRQSRIDEAFQQIHRAVSVDPKLAVLAVSRCWDSDPDINRILDSLLPATSEAYWGALDFFVKARQPKEAIEVWKRLTASGTSFSIERGFPLLDLLIAEGRADDAKSAWQLALSASAIKPKMDPDGSLIWNGSFDGNLLNGGFDWRYLPVDGASMSFDEGNVHSGTRSLQIVFDGTVNLNFSQIWEWVVVEPNKHYRFSAYFRSEELTTESGLYFEIEAQAPPENSSAKADPVLTTPNVTGTQPWTLEDIEFTTGPETRLLRIVLRRPPSSMLSNKIRGTVWVDDVSLVPVDAVRGQ